MQLKRRLDTMADIVDQRIAELLCSRLCHELVAGIAAINNGVELITEIDSSMMDEALELIGSSARQSSGRLQFYRMAYGLAGNEALKGISEVRDLVEKLVAGDDRIAAEVRESDANTPLGPGWGKLLLNLFVFGVDCLPRGGKVTYGLADGSQLTVVAAGDGARIPGRYEGFPDPGIRSDDVTALNVHAYYTAVLAKTVGGGLRLDLGEDVISLGVGVSPKEE